MSITTPTPQELAEAIESLQRMVDAGVFVDATTDKMRALLAAARAPRPTDTVDAETVSVVMAIAACFGAWEDDVRVLGNIRADAGRDALLRILNARAPRLTEAQREAVKWAYERLMLNACPNDEDAGEALRAAFAGELGEVGRGEG